MKKILFSLLVIFLFSPSTGSVGQSAPMAASGIYLTETDFKVGKLTNSAPLDENNFIVAELGTLKVFRNGSKVKYRFGDVYGFYQNGVKYRAYRRHLFFDRPEYYKVIDESSLMVYSLRSSGHKGPHYSFFYYSLKPGSPIIPINKRTMTKAFSTDPDLVNRVKKAIKNKTIVNQDSTGVTELNKLFNSVADKHLF